MHKRSQSIRSLLLGFAALLCGTTALAQQWNQVFTSNSPGPRLGAAAAYDEARGVVVLFGGWDGHDHYAETWEFDGTDWHLCHPPVSPPARRGHAMAYDANRHVVVMYGGWDPALPGKQNDTWEYDGRTWTQVETPTQPPANWQHRLAFDRDRGVIVMTSGVWGDGHPQTWEYDGQDWRKVTTEDHPGWRKHPGLAWDPTRSSLVFFGGAGSVGGAPVYDDTWEFDGANWYRFYPEHAPSPREAGRMAWFGPTRELIYFGGASPASGGHPRTYFNDTWAFSNGDWNLVETTTSPPPRELFAFAYDSARGVIVMFGGRNSSGFLGDTWEYRQSCSPGEVCIICDPDDPNRCVAVKPPAPR